MENDFTARLARGELAGGKEEATLASRLFLIATLIVNTTEEDNLLVFAGILNIIANINVVKAAFLEAKAQQIAPGVTTYANTLKIIGGSGALVVSLIFFIALLIEVSVRQRVTGTSAVPTAAGALGAFNV
ncbi:hypothetical protein [Clostridium sp. DJ247]|uniref:hypothetical protein n=1 Tax=Clostridium sp. DJ247 TaxID=2726188 RepID=UPI0016251C96|nr:hypothetical protein [Clostridium sp. DJ247]MBC2582403.1 hypothetical protein [Clostridium sp. DJ247]